MRVFFSTGEASGELVATELAAALQALQPGLRFEGIGGERMRGAGFTIRRDTRGWASMGLYEALKRIPTLLSIMLMTALELRRDPPDVVVLVDFGAFNLRLARQLRRLGFDRPIVYAFPPGAWFDRVSQAQKVAAASVPLVPFRHQFDFYTSLDLRAAYFGHPLASTISPRPARRIAPANGGLVAVLPGSRTHELEHHTPLVLAAARLLRERRPELRLVIGAASSDAERFLRRRSAAYPDLSLAFAAGARAALAEADAALVASGTVVLEAALLGVPAVALYVVTAAQARYGRRIYKREFATLPNLVLERAIVPELLQEAATPARLALELEHVLTDPAAQLAGFAEVRAALGPRDALDRWARFVLDIAQARVAR